MGQGDGTQIKATTPLPVDCPEQKLEGGQVQTQGCEAQVRDVGESPGSCACTPADRAGANDLCEGQLQGDALQAVPQLPARPVPREQSVPADVGKQYLGDSPGIQTRSKEVHDLLRTLRGDLKHAWDLAEKFAAWIPHNMRPQIGPYTGVITALEKRQGDCAEMSAVFVALCRAAGIPARLVWVPDHNWAEIYLTDKGGKGHWIPVHTACYFWFGWTGAHELVIQKGDRLHMPDRGNRLFRLQEDWMQWGGTVRRSLLGRAYPPAGQDRRRSRPRRPAEEQDRRVEARRQSPAGSLHAAVGGRAYCPRRPIWLDPPVRS